MFMVHMRDKKVDILCVFQCAAQLALIRACRFFHHRYAYSPFGMPLQNSDQAA
jgi:methylphosphotriester-DNA--protein-cysteine methyltransferase